MSRMIGIDLGTTNSVASYIRKTEPRVVDNQDSEPLTPSVIHLSQAGEWIVGKTAKKAAGMSEEDAGNTVFSIKRFMGRDYTDRDCAEDISKAPYKLERAENGEVDAILRGRRFSPPELSAFVLESLKRSAELFLDEEVHHAVITVPAYFGNRQRDATRLAGRLAGLNVLRIIPEPTAAALAYGIASESDDPKTILVYDLGGGTFDVTVMFIGAGVFEDQGKSGDMHLGGDNFDYKIMDWMFEQIRIQHGVDLRSTANKEVKFRLKQAAEDAKLSLSKTTRTQIVIPALTKQGGKIIDLECELKREDFNGMIKSLVDRSVDLVYEAIKLARTTPDGIDAILLVGGSTGVPLVVDTIRSIFGSKVIRGEINPMYCVAQGAAIETMLVKDVGAETDEAIVQCASCGALNLKSRAECRICRKSFGAGGVVEMDQVRKEARPTIPCPKCETENPMGTQECENCGASMLDAKGPIHVLNTTSHPIGVQVVGDKMEVIIPEATIYPMQEPKTKLLKTTRDGMTVIRLPVYEGRDPVASKNELLGQAQGTLEGNLPEGTNVEVALSIDKDGIIYVRASLPDRPGSEIKASMRWQREARAGDDGRAESPRGDGSGSPEFAVAWKNQAQFVLFQAGAVKEEGEGLVSPADLDHIVQLGAELLMAIQANDELKAQRVMSQLEPLINQYGVFVLLTMMRVISQTPDITANVPSKHRREFEDLTRKLELLVRQADQAKQQRNFGAMAMAATQGNPIIERIMKILGESDLAGAGDLLSGLLRGSTD
ncbi:MAG: Hsp70 family protein [Chloroflexota bacterium]